jgi:hypothetical protein
MQNNQRRDKKTNPVKYKDIQSNKKVITTLPEFKVMISHSTK